MDNALMPAVSVLMSVFNGAPFLREAVESILCQTFGDFEFIIINDGSSDGSAEILHRYAGEDSRIVLIERENKGLIASLNEGLSCARAPLIARMDADDIALPERLALQKAYMDDHADVSALGGALVLIDEKGRAFGKHAYPRRGATLDRHLYERGSPVAHPAVMMRRDAVLKLGGYRPAYKHAEDYDLWLRLRKTGAIDNLPATILKYRQHPGKISLRHAEQQALASVIARHAARAKTDPTDGLERLSVETLSLFSGGQEALKWEMTDLMAANLLLSPDAPALQELEERLPSVIPAEGRVFAARTFLKMAVAVFRLNEKGRALCYAAKAFVASPRAVCRLLSAKVCKSHA